MDVQQPFYLLFGLVGLLGGGLTIWFIMAQHPFENTEPPVGPVDQLEAPFLAKEMTDRGRPIEEETVTQLLDLHTAYVEGRLAEERSRTEAIRLEAERAAQPES